MSVTPIRPLEQIESEKDARIRQLEEQLSVVQAARWFDRFHALDGLENDCCPSCGSPVIVEETAQTEDGLPPGVRLKAARTELLDGLNREREWLREGIEVALKHLQNGSRSLAAGALKGTLAGKEGCW